MPVSAQPTPAAIDPEAIWHEFHDGLLAFINRRVRSRETAEDILQEVMLRIHRQAAGIKRAEAVGAWIHTIAANAIADHYRSAAVRHELTANDELDPEAADEAEADTQDLRTELASCVRPLLEQLPASHREALSLTELDGITQAEAAAHLGLSLSGMKSRVQRAREQLKQVLIHCCEVELDVRGSLTDYRPRRGSCDCGAAPTHPDDQTSGETTHAACCS